MDIQFTGETLLPGKVGQFFIVLAFAAALLSTISYFFATRSKDQADQSSWTRMGRISYGINVLSIIGIGATLFYLILNHYNEYYYVYSHSSKALPVYYIISAFWEGQEGSFWLWAFWQAVLGIVLIRTCKSWESGVMTVVGLSQVFLTSMLLGVQIFGERIGSSPFILLRDAVNLQEMAPVVFADPENFKNYLKFITDGRGLNPLLQNYWMVIHPPTLFLGFASMIVPFAYVITGLWQKRYKEWVKPAMPWALFAVMILGTGIIMGSFWAYEALNFGGFWAWDPVENASLIPWLTLIGAVHVMIAFKNTGHAFFTSIALVLVSFILVLYASFLTRSGILGETSVHSFTDLGMFGHLILYNVVFLFIPVVLIICRWKELPITNKEEETYSREFWMFIGALVVTVACIQVIFSTSVPVFNKAFGTNFAPPIDAIKYYNQWQAPFAILITMISGFSQFLKYKRTDTRKFYSSLIATLVIAIVVTGAFVYITDVYGNLMYILLSFSCMFAILSNARILVQGFSGKGKLVGAAVAHIGFALLLVGALVAAATSKPVSLNAANFIPVKDFEKVEKPGENMVLYKNEPKKMGRFTVTYTNDTTIAPNTFYTLNFKVLDEKSGAVKENFDLNPRVQINEKMGLIASPDTKHYLTYDMYTHITSAPDKKDSHAESDAQSDEENYKKPRIVNVSTGDTLHTSSGIIHIKDLNFKPVAKSLALAEGDLAVGLPLEIDLNGKIYKTEPIFLVKGNNTFDFARNIPELGLRLRFTKILPDQKKVELQVFEKPQQSKDWVVFKAIEFPYINLYWVGLIVMVVGFLISIVRRQKENVKN
ncbi:heme lyase CcmF/NrfE family subunit [Pedobacter antarcticus]|uniref:Cytochrome C biogenesis protein n=2 Tax=Pedobacter antarcticus TaxID=34086 RepID=A0A081PFE4_9SPHI|nr:cytochrome c biogenesis protein CcsA [Pedobacter antarcticus]KEQ29417.1 cytochrome C biogenesis protein [Pedobacter antarcticus 4BY]SDM67756.1 cytochrome c-type biogenesis protein CcmF [Pedobacter antarcticus]SFF39956.1 cytochrome c-type biogenesis protein CcmF [Pedobacter antarcticus]